MCCKTKFKNIRAFSLLSVEIRHIMRYNVFVILCGNCKLWGFTMSVCYKRLWHLLIDKDMKKKDLMEKANISDYTIRKLNRGDNVTTDILVRICHALDCHIEDIMEVLPEDKRE